ncbi:MAG: alpha/beta hydrolase [Myxococcales bacterium]|nr:alpha/beta hydrolase [Myxococcales bacterium]
MSDPRADADPEMAPLLDAMRERKSSRVLEARALREGFDATIPALVAGAPEMSLERELEIPTEGVSLRALVFQPEPGPTPAPVLVYLHGGGWVMMSPDSHARIAKELAVAAGAIVVSVEYRLAPEHPYPAPLDDALAAFRWVRAHAHELGGDPTRVGLGGDSAGGNLTAAATLRLLANAEAPPRATLLICPVTDAALDTGSFRRLAPDDPVLDGDLMRFFRDSYVTREQWEDPFVSPLRARLDDFPPACLLAAELDPLCDDALLFSERLDAAGRPSTLLRYPGLPHDFMLFPGISANARAFEEMGAFLRDQL